MGGLVLLESEEWTAVRTGREAYQCFTSDESSGRPSTLYVKQ